MFATHRSHLTSVVRQLKYLFNICDGVAHVLRCYSISRPSKQDGGAPIEIFVLHVYRQTRLEMCHPSLLMSVQNVWQLMNNSAHLHLLHGSAKTLCVLLSLFTKTNKNVLRLARCWATTHSDTFKDICKMNPMWLFVQLISYQLFCSKDITAQTLMWIYSSSCGYIRQPAEQVPPDKNYSAQLPSTLSVPFLIP